MRSSRPFRRSPAKTSERRSPSQPHQRRKTFRASTPRDGLKIKLDESVTAEAARVLAALGHEVDTTAAEGLKRIDSGQTEALL